MKSHRLFATATLIGAISFAMPLQALAKCNSIQGGTKDMYDGAKEAEMRDAAITAKIKTALAIYPITKSATIHVNTDKPIANLSGDVPDVSVIEGAKEIAQNTEHLKSVRNHLKSGASPTVALNETMAGSEEAARESDCLETPIFSVKGFDLAQSTDREGANAVYAPSVVLTFAADPLRVSVCPSAIHAWR